MQFGKHTPSSERDRGIPGVMQTFTRSTVVGGKQWKFRFDNGFGASVINDGYGRESGLYELAVTDANEDLTYDTPITSEVLGYLSEAEVADALNRVAALDADSVAAEIKRRADADRDERIAALWAELADLESEVQS